MVLERKKYGNVKEGWWLVETRTEAIVGPITRFPMLKTES
jgi:hypothetical protein